MPYIILIFIYNIFMRSNYFYVKDQNKKHAPRCRQRDKAMNEVDCQNTVFEIRN